MLFIWVLTTTVRQHSVINFHCVLRVSQSVCLFTFYTGEKDNGGQSSALFPWPFPAALFIRSSLQTAITRNKFSSHRLKKSCFQLSERFAIISPANSLLSFGIKASHPPEKIPVTAVYQLLQIRGFFPLLQTLFFRLLLSTFYSFYVQKQR